MIDYHLKGKVALVTGVSRKNGIGAAICKMLAKNGTNIFTTYFEPYDKSKLWGTNQNEAKEILSELQEFGVNVDGIEKDLHDIDAASYIFNAAEQALGGVDILINNAASSCQSDIFDLTPKELDEAYAVNLRSTLLLCSEFAKRHDGREGGRVIILTSGQGENVMPNEIPYIVTKAGLDTFVKSAKVSLAKKRITINAIDPGATDTGWMSRELYEQVCKSNPTGRVGMPEDVARLAIFLASKDAQWITGQIIRSNGGG